MILKGINCQIPSQKISNSEILELVKFYSLPKYENDIDELLHLIRNFLKITGTKSRFWRGVNETPIKLIERAISEALKMASITTNDIDVVLYSSIHRGFIEPSNANIISHSLGLKSNRNFDIVDACMGWCTASHVAQSLLKSEKNINNILIITSECPMDQNGAIIPENFTIKSKEELNWKVPSLTIGEAVSASIFQRSSEENKYVFLEKSEYADLCTIPLFTSNQYTLNSEKMQNKKKFQFSAYSKELSTKGMKHALQALQILLEDIEYEPHLIFPHSVSKRVIDYGGKNLGIQDIIYSTFEELGNVATTSIPSAISKAILNGKLKNNQKCIGWIASAGMKFSAFELNY